MRIDKKGVVRLRYQVTDERVANPQPLLDQLWRETEVEDAKRVADGDGCSAPWHGRRRSIPLTSTTMRKIFARTHRHFIEKCARNAVR